MAICGVYAIFGPRGVYVGESDNVLRRLREHVIAPGFDWTIVAYLPDGAQRRERQRLEQRISDRYRAAGISVVSHTSADTLRAVRAKQSPAERSAQARRAQSAIRPEVRSSAARKAQAGRGAEARSASARKGYANRSANWKADFSRRGQAAITPAGRMRALEAMRLAQDKTKLSANGRKGALARWHK